jgi:hypothetical protein
MTEYAFAETDTEVIDAAPSDDYEYSCEVCGTELFYGGRGRKPKFCDDHRKTATRTTSTVKGAGKGGALARQAATALGQLNGLIGIALMLAPKPWNLPTTASALAGATEGFEEQAYKALLSDPKLCALILRGGAMSGRVALVIAYGMLAGAVVPVAMAELKLDPVAR